MSNADRDQRTLPPTAKRIQEFRDRGEIALSKDLSSLVTMIGGAVVCFVGAGVGGRQVAAFMHADLHSLDAANPGTALGQAAALLIAVGGPVIGGAVVGYIISAAVQLGWPPAFGSPKWEPERVLSVQHLGNMFSPMAGAGRVLKSAAKIGFVGAAAAVALSHEVEAFRAEPILGARALSQHLFTALVRLGAYAGTALAALAALDYVMARRTLTAKMKMTPEEFKREHREQEGDPQIKRRRRQRMRELAQRRLAVAVKTADVVLVNPTEYAVALRYHSTEDRAPRVVAKGRGLVAERIRELARSAGIPILAQPPLTRLIHKVVPEGREIPSSLYHAVAEVLAYVYKLRQRHVTPAASATGNSTAARAAGAGGPSVSNARERNAR